MSNPAVITLASANTKGSKFSRFVLEDNIGESIHLHVDNTRVDFTITEFLDFSKLVRESLTNLDVLCGYKLKDFDEHFLNECSAYLKNLKKIEIEEIRLEKLRCVVYSKYKFGLKFMKLLPVRQTPAFRYLQGDKTDFLSYEQYNYLGINNESRLLNLLELMKDDKFKADGSGIVLFNGQNVIRDGQHRAAILGHLSGLDSNIKVIRFTFAGKDHLLRVAIKNLGMFCRWLLCKVRLWMGKIF